MPVLTSTMTSNLSSWKQVHESLMISPPDHVQIDFDKYLGDLYDTYYVPKLITNYSASAPLYVHYFRSLSLDLVHKATPATSTPLQHIQLFIEILSSLGLQFP